MESNSLSLSLSLIQVLRNEIFSPFGIFSFFLLEYLGRQGGSGARKGKARQAFRETRGFILIISCVVGCPWGMDRAHFAHKLFLVRRAEVFLPFLHKHLLNKQSLLPFGKSIQVKSIQSQCLVNNFSKSYFCSSRRLLQVYEAIPWITFPTAAMPFSSTSRCRNTEA